MATVTPWLFGGVQAAVRAWLFVAVLIPLALWLIGQWKVRSSGTALPTAVIPLMGAVGLGVLQLIPLENRASEFLSPAGAELYRTLLPTPSSPDATLASELSVAPAADRHPVSLYPASTRRDLALLLFGAAVFLSGAVFFASPRAQLWLCGALAVNGALLAFFGLVQKLTWNGLLYWRVPLTHGGAPFGPFVNRNNAGAFLNLCLAGAVGWMIWVVGRDRSRFVEMTPARRGLKPSRLEQAWQQVLGFLAHLNGLTIAAVAFTGCIVAGVLCSLSRGAGLAMIGATGLTAVAVLCARRRELRLWPVWAAALGGVILVGWVGMTGPVHDRFAALLDQQALLQNRMPHWRDGLKAVPDYWRLGSGLGTYRYVYRPYQHRLDQVWYRHAENQYLETLVETGVVGFGLLVLLIGLVGTAAWRLLRDDEDARSLAFGMACIFALAGQAIHAFFDFALAIPANALVFALLCGAVSGRAAHLAQWRAAPKLLALPKARFLSALLGALVLGGMIWSCLETRCAAAVEKTLRRDRLTSPPCDVSPRSILDAMERLQAAMQGREDDAEAEHRMATLWLHLYRVRAFGQLRREMGTDADDQRLWEATSQIVLHGRAHQFARNRRSSELEELRNEPVIRDHLIPALRHLILARRACPLIPDVHVTTAELCVLAGDPADDRVHIERSQRLAPGDPDLYFRCGLLDLQAGRVDSACASWRKSLSLTPKYIDDVLLLAGQTLSPSRTIEHVLPDSPSFLIELAQQRYQAEEEAAFRHMLAERAKGLAAQADVPEEERHYLRGSAFALQEDYPQAIKDLTRAVELRPGEAHWRYQLALLLERQGRHREAHQHAKLCARLDRANEKYRTLLRSIHEKRVTTITGSN